MKKLSILITSFFLLFLLFACNKSKENLYSCNDLTEEYVQISLTGNQSISRDSLALLPVDTQFAIFRTLTSGNKYRIFQEKIIKLIDEETLTVDEVAHLQSLHDYENFDIYTTSSDSSADSFLVAWEDFARNDLNWDDQKVFIFVETWLSPNEFDGFAGTAQNDCNCLYSLGCPGWGHCTYGTNCNIPPKGGCGIMGTSNCKGRCP